MSNHPLQKKLAQAAQDSLSEIADIKTQDRLAEKLWKLVSELSTSDKRLLYKLIEADLADRPSDNHNECG